MGKVPQFLESQKAYSIASPKLQAAFAPEMGGRMLSLRYNDAINVLVPMAPHRFDILEWPRAGAYPLFPYHNRLAGAKVRAGDQTVVLASHPAASPHTLHGPAHARPWRVSTHAYDHLVMDLDYRSDADWPWDFTAVQDFRVRGSVLVATFSLINKASTAMPGGMGWHPYFASTAQPSSDANFVWTHRDDYLPTGEKQAILDRAEQEGKATSYLDDWKSAKIVCDAGAIATMTASAPFDYLVIHRGDPSHVCVEPTTHVTNAWNLKACASSVGALLLQPGQVITGKVKLKISP